MGVRLSGGHDLDSQRPTLPPMTIHSEHPFVPDPEERDEARRFRGRLSSPVTIVTAGNGDARTGLTVSSIFVVEGEPPTVTLVVGPTSDLWDSMEDTGRFVVHVCRQDYQGVADVFAGLRPSPGGVFSGTETIQSDWGPVIVDLKNRAYCSVATMEERGYSAVVVGNIEKLDISELNDPLAYFRGKYRSLE